MRKDIAMANPGSTTAYGLVQRSTSMSGTGAKRTPHRDVGSSAFNCPTRCGFVRQKGASSAQELVQPMNCAPGKLDL